MEKFGKDETSLNRGHPNFIKNIIKSKARDMGFDLCGIASVQNEICIEHLREWVDMGYHAKMLWFERNMSMRENIKKWFPEVKSVVVVGRNYFHECDISTIALFAHTEDYHNVIREKLKILGSFLTDIVDDFKYKISVDTGSVHEKSWAVRAGLGWQGKNTLVIHPSFGSWFSIGLMAVNLELESDPVMDNQCGICSLCIDACPTKAIHQEGFIDCNQCISYHTIENKDKIPEQIIDKMGTTIFGCDICQKVCPWNKNKISKSKNRCIISKYMGDKDLYKIDKQKFYEIFHCTPVKRIGFNGIRRNIEIY